MLPNSSDGGDIWTRRSFLVLSGVRPGARYNLPFFAHNALGAVRFADAEGNGVLPFCEDAFYKAPDHRLLWVDYRGLDKPSEDGEAEVDVMLHVYFCREALISSARDAVELLVSPRHDVLLFADDFASSTAAEAALKRWTMHAQEVRQSARIKVTKAPEAADGAPRPFEYSLTVDPSDGELIFSRRMPLRCTGRLQFRAHVHDFCAVGAHQWIGFTSHPAAFAVGLHPKFKDHYAFFCSIDADGGWGTDQSWQQLKTPRTIGWHVLELVLQDKWLSIIVDDKRMGGVPVPSVPTLDDELCLGTIRGPCASWAAVELLHTPFGDKRWEVGVQKINPDRPRTWKPWLAGAAEEGKWATDVHGKMESLLPPPEIEQIDAQADDTPSEALEGPVAPMPQSFEHQSDASNLAMDCWSLGAPESDVERIERVMAHVLAQLRRGGVTLPESIKRLETEADARVAGCYVYSFGSRRLHVAVREGDGQKLSLVVRAGGGFFDFVEFVQKNGAAEQAKQRKYSLGERQAAGSASRVVRDGRR